MIEKNERIEYENILTYLRLLDDTKWHDSLGWASEAEAVRESFDYYYQRPSLEKHREYYQKAWSQEFYDVHFPRSLDKKEISMEIWLSPKGTIKFAILEPCNTSKNKNIEFFSPRS